MRGDKRDLGLLSHLRLAIEVLFFNEYVPKKYSCRCGISERWYGILNPPYLKFAKQTAPRLPDAARTNDLSSRACLCAWEICARRR
jgi:hypothetical protein